MCPASIASASTRDRMVSSRLTVAALRGSSCRVGVSRLTFLNRSTSIGLISASRLPLKWALMALQISSSSGQDFLLVFAQVMYVLSMNSLKRGVACGTLP